MMSRARLAGIKREQDRDQPAHDMRVAVAVEGEHRPGGAVRLHVRDQPDLAGAALHLVGSMWRALGNGASVRPSSMT